MVINPDSTKTVDMLFTLNGFNAMRYTRKTKDIFVLRWNGEDIDEAETRADRDYLVKEYNLAYRGGVTWKRKRVPINAN